MKPVDAVKHKDGTTYKFGREVEGRRPAVDISHHSGTKILLYGASLQCIYLDPEEAVQLMSILQKHFPLEALASL
jgi:hypothetical protein